MFDLIIVSLIIVSHRVPFSLTPEDASLKEFDHKYFDAFSIRISHSLMKKKIILVHCVQCWQQMHPLYKTRAVFVLGLLFRI